MENNDIDNIELRSEKVRHIIGKVPPVLVRTGTVIITIVVMAVAFYTIHYPITIEVQGQVLPHDTVEIMVPYKFLYLFNEQRKVSVTYEGEADDIRPHVYPISSYSTKLIRKGFDNYFAAKVCVGSDSSMVQVGQKADARILVSDKTLWQQVFH